MELREEPERSFQAIKTGKWEAAPLLENTNFLSFQIMENADFNEGGGPWPTEIGMREHLFTF